MKLQFNKRYVRIGITAFLVIAASICFYYLVFHGDRFSAQVNAFFRIISPVMYGIIFAYLMTPLVNGIENRFLFPFFQKDGQQISVKQKKICQNPVNSSDSMYCRIFDLRFLFHFNS